MPNGNGPTTKRIESLADSIFSFAMTILVLNLTIPHIAGNNIKDLLYHLLYVQANDVFSYFLSFFLLANFWIINHGHFIHIQRTNTKHLWINIMILMFIVLIPFTTSLIDQYPELQLSNILFDLNMFIVGILYYLDWAYATHKHRLVDTSLTKESVILSKKRGLVIPLLSIVAIGLALPYPSYSTAIYLFAPILVSLIR